MKFTKGQAVTQVQPAPIQGEVIGFDLDQESGTVTVKVGWTDADGGHERYFTEDELM